MVTKNAEPDLDSWHDRRTQRQRNRGRGRRVTAFAVAAAIVAIATAAYVARSGSGEGNAAEGSGPGLHAVNIETGDATIFARLPEGTPDALRTTGSPSPCPPRRIAWRISRTTSMGARRYFVMDVDGTRDSTAPT